MHGSAQRRHFSGGTPCRMPPHAESLNVVQEAEAGVEAEEAEGVHATVFVCVLGHDWDLPTEPPLVVVVAAVVGVGGGTRREEEEGERRAGQEKCTVHLGFVFAVFFLATSEFKTKQH